MKKRTAALILLLLVLGGAAYMRYESKAKEASQEALRAEARQRYTEKMAAEKSLLLRNQTVDGAILTYYQKAEEPPETRSYRVNPYFACIAARGLLVGAPTAQQLDAVKKYISWHIAHTETDGTIYDFEGSYADGGITWQSSAHCDSVDAYAALFLLLVKDYYDATQDPVYLSSISGYVDRVAARLLSVQLENGLSINKEESGVAYLMDNVEVNCALRDAATLYDEVYSTRNDLTVTAAVLRQHYAENSAAIERYLWDETERRYRVAVNAEGEELDFHDKTKLYPYWTTQLYPQLWGYAAGGDRAATLYQALCAAFDWQSLSFRSKTTSSYWCMLGYAAALNGDAARAEEYLESLDAAMPQGRYYPFYCGESGFLLFAYQQMRSKI